MAVDESMKLRCVALLQLQTKATSKHTWKEQVREKEGGNRLEETNTNKADDTHRDTVVFNLA